MKFYRIAYGIKKPWKQIFKIMKLTVILLFGSLMALSASTYSQSTRLNLAAKNSSLIDIFRQIEDQSEFYFYFKKEEVKSKESVTIELKDALISEILDKVLVKTGLEYKIIDRYVVVKEKGTADPEMTVQQQGKKVTGKVTDQTGASVPGTSVVIKGTTTGVVTDSDGSFSLSNIPENAVLQFSFVGMKPQELSVQGKITINVKLEEETIGIEEVVAIGYGTIRKSDLTGAVTKIKIEEYLELPNVNVLQSLQGSVAGFNVGAVDKAGGDPTISIRGQNTLSNNYADSAPLIVLDGSIYRGSISDIQPSDIESVDILKDASSASIYGSQASNGVVIITTKKGKKSDKPIITYTGSYTIQVPSNKVIPMKSKELEKFMNDMMWAQGSRNAPDYLTSNPKFSFVPILKTLEIAEGYAKGLDTDWWGSLTGNGLINSHTLSLQGKEKKIDYFLSGGVTYVKGFMENEDYSRYNARINIDAEVSIWLNVGLNTFLTSSDYSGVSPNVGTAYILQPWAPIKDDKGVIIPRPEGLRLNPYLEIQNDDSDTRLNINANIYAKIVIPKIKGFEYKLNYYQNYITSNHNLFDPWAINYTGYSYKNSYINYDWALDNIFNYKNTINGVHNLNFTFVYGLEKRDYSLTEASAQNFTNKELGFNKLEAGNPQSNIINTGKEKESSVYSMARLFYNYKNKYLVTGTVRRDGFSGFGSNNKIGIFPSIALGWVLSEENLFKEHKNVLNYQKVRVSYGSTGRRASGRYDTRARVNSNPSVIFGDGGQATIGQWISSMSNNALGWEKTTGLNVGYDYGLFNSKIKGNIEYYNNNTKDILYAIQLPTMTGFQSVFTNIGKVHNSGIELSLEANLLNKKDIKWDLSFNFTRNRNKIESILGADNNKDGVEDNLTANLLFIGKPQKVIYDYEIVGMWQLNEKNIPSGFYPGTYKISDINGDDKYSASDDKKILGYVDPSYQFGIANTISYKNFSLYMFINSIQGGKDYFWGDDSPYLNAFYTGKDGISMTNAPAGAWDYWMPENPNAKYHRLDMEAAYNPRPYSQRSFVRLQDLSLSYSFKSSVLHKIDIRNFKFFLSGKNLLTITKWKGWDPETGTGFGPGVPVMANYCIGVNVEF